MSKRCQTDYAICYEFLYALYAEFCALVRMRMILKSALAEP